MWYIVLGLHLCMNEYTLSHETVNEQIRSDD
jgi:hypothetical protein